MSESRELFGGAMACRIPSTWRDVSQVRQVPDNQEVYQDCSEESGAVLVVEILEHQSDVKNEDAPTFFFADLADANGVSQDDLTIQPNDMVFSVKDEDATKQRYFQKFSLSTQQSDSHACIAVGKQQVSEKSLRIEMCVLRLTNVTTDLMITLSIPDNKQCSVGDDGLSSVFRELLATFCVRDW
eukprot:CAMPEP_0113420328 /NCGR_PEP_ID=MMETSP0013_2-20120614/27270_1 /TAXON_ID=2843 ORGANISM="Skeletonema costatum, Strain 1716" /NCGR_SAMPLE_ID=MMETSP0013_2 /ASSEMBLY_ACC=CAM_ASM_000158 /LENGTH=183 /DNA_ID=CAMNT_0000307801 /DNA_START=73 /DNA_END=621 /DNA_ORIENTATION=- /assembly_acc=CAM_ASM_000158